MRKVLSPDMVAHVWANKAQDEARNAGETFYFTGPTIYSYGSHFAIAHHLDNGVILWNNAGYSNTTSRHKSLAWRALSRTQRETSISVNGLNSDLIRNLEYCRTYKEPAAAGRVPDLVKSCADSALTAVKSIVGMRSLDKMAAALHSAREYQKAGLALCEYVRQGKKAPKWPLPLLPETLPQDKAERESMVRSVAKSSLMETCNEALTAFKERFASVKEDVNNPNLEAYTAQNFAGALNSCAAKLDEAAKHYAMANPGKKLPRLAAYQKELAEVKAQAKIAHDAAQIRYTIKGLKTMVRTIAKRAPRRNKLGHGKQHAMRLGSGAVSRNFAGLRDAFEAYAPTCPEIASYAWLVGRIQRIDAWHAAEQAWGNVDSYVSTARSYQDGSELLIKSQGRDNAGYWKDATRQYKTVLAALRSVIACAPFARLHAERIEAIRTEANDYVSKAVEREREANAQVIADWKAGISNVRPSFDAGTFARIKGDTVETSRGASVPLEHACRLARIARRLIGHGGKTWSDGTGPQVGHFRVSSIFDDGSAVIGCHEFDADESMRVLALLDACPACVAA